MEKVNDRKLYLEKFEKQVDRLFSLDLNEGGLTPATYCDAQEFINICKEYKDAEAEKSYKAIKEAAAKFLSSCKMQMEDAEEAGNTVAFQKYCILKTEAEIIKLTMSLRRTIALDGELRPVQLTDMSETDVRLFDNLISCPNCKSHNLAVVYNANNHRYYVQCQECRSRLHKYSADSISGAMETWNICCRMADEICRLYDPDSDSSVGSTPFVPSGEPLTQM